jgi:LysR family glycine cleavage system transcriptional activator
LMPAGGVLSPTELSRFVLLHDTHNQWPAFIETVLSGTVSVGSKSVRFNHSSHAIEAAIVGQGMALVSSVFVEQDIATGRLVRAFEQTMRAATDFYVVAPRRPQNPQSVAKVRDWLLGHQQPSH